MSLKSTEIIERKNVEELSMLFCSVSFREAPSYHDIIFSSIYDPPSNP